MAVKVLRKHLSFKLCIEDIILFRVAWLWIKILYIFFKLLLEMLACFIYSTVKKHVFYYTMKFSPLIIICGVERIIIKKNMSTWNIQPGVYLILI